MKNAMMVTIPAETVVPIIAKLKSPNGRHAETGSWKVRKNVMTVILSVTMDAILIACSNHHVGMGLLRRERIVNLQIPQRVMSTASVKVPVAALVALVEAQALVGMTTMIGGTLCAEMELSKARNSVSAIHSAAREIRVCGASVSPVLLSVATITSSKGNNVKGMNSVFLIVV
jgi:hypothetical protein